MMIMDATDNTTKQESNKDSSTSSTEKPPSWWKQLFKKPIERVISTRSDLINEIRKAETKGLIEADELGMIEGVMQVDHLQARDIMISRSQIKFIHRDSSFSEILKQVLKSGHSRYPVIDDNKDDVEGILHAKDLLKFIGKDKKFVIGDILRDTLHAPETQRVDELLTEFKKSRNHMAVIVDEYGGISGLVTIEDVLETIVGEIDDEHDVEEKPNIQKRSKNLFIVNALTPVEEFNEYFHVNEDLDPFDTIGGLITHRIGRIPQQAEYITTTDFKFTVLSSDGRRIQLLEVIPLQEVVSADDKNDNDATNNNNNKSSDQETSKNNDTITRKHSYKQKKEVTSA